MDDHFDDPATADPTWLRFVGERGWIAVSHNWKIRRFEPLPPQASTASQGEPVRDFRLAVPSPSQIRSMRFGWFSKSIYAEARFDSDTERRMAVIIDTANEVVKWARLAGPPLRIDWGYGAAYEPDFVVEAGDRKYLVETKAANQMDDPEVLAKALAATTWCRHASAYATQQPARADRAGVGHRPLRPG